MTGEKMRDKKKMIGRREGKESDEGNREDKQKKRKDSNKIQKNTHKESLRQRER